MKIFSYIVISCLLGLIACGGSGEGAVSAKAIDGFLDREDIKNRPYLKIKTNALARDFLFYGTFIPMLNSPTGHSLKGRIVRFEVFADRVVMLESPKGHSLAKQADSTILLAEFPIVQSDSDGLIIDFAKGMTSAFTSRNVNSREASDKDSDTAEQFKAIVLSASFIKSINTEQDVLTISQIAQWRNTKSELISAEFRYFFREYMPSPDFKKKIFGKNRWVQYFSTPSQVQANTTENLAYIAKWPINKPIVFYISANTPPEYLQAIKDGILYWNHIFGRDILQVENLAAHLSAPHPKFNIVQWVAWDNEASAYADMVVDHLSGETLQAQIYLRSGWVFKSVKKLRSQLEDILLIEPGEEGPAVIEENVPMPSMFDYDEPCYKALDNQEALGDLAEIISAAEISPETIQILTADIIRAVVAHEMGHVLGLRHNLGSSTFSNISLNERLDFLKSYLKTGSPVLGHEKYLSHSMMDVFSAADDAMIGSQIRELNNSQLKDIYQYDSQAIEYGYLDQAMRGNTPFCTDDDIPRFLDCQRWDISNTPVLYAASRLEDTLNQVATVMAENFAATIDPDREGGQMSINDIQITTKGVNKTLASNIKQLFLWFSRQARSIEIETDQAAYSSYNLEDINKLRFMSIRDQLQSQGLNQTLFSLIPPYRQAHLDPESILAKFSFQFVKQILEISKKHPDFSVSEEELSIAANIARRFLTTLSKEYITVFGLTLASMHFDDPELQEPIEKSLGQIAREIILTSDQSGKAPNTSVLPVFKYDLANRDAAAKLLAPALGLWSDWSFDNLIYITNQLKLIMRRHAASEGGSSIDLSTVPREKRQWLLEQNRILNTLSQVKTQARPISP